MQWRIFEPHRTRAQIPVLRCLQSTHRDEFDGGLKESAQHLRP
jgi:hypothetical protein